jgi:hypothetical protein
VFGIASHINPTPAFPAGATFPTEAHEYAAGLRFRIPFGAENELDVPVTFGEHAFVFHSGNNANRADLQMPDVIYHYVRAGVEARVALPLQLSLFAGGGYRYVVNKGGPIGTAAFFPGLTVGGFDAHLGAGYQILPAIEIRASVDLRRYFFSMHSQSGDMFAADSGTDQYIGYTLMAAFTLGADAKRAGAAEAAPAAAAPPAPRRKAKPAGDREGAGGDEAGGD